MINGGRDESEDDELKCGQWADCDEDSLYAEAEEMKQKVDDWWTNRVFRLSTVISFIHQLSGSEQNNKQQNNQTKLIN